MNVILAIPIFGLHRSSKDCVSSIIETAPDNGVQVVIVDNGSFGQERPEIREFVDSISSDIKLISPEKNLGFFRPLDIVSKMAEKDDIVAIMHDDVIIYEKDWHKRLIAEYEKNPYLGCVGFCGSSELDEHGGRGVQTMCNFKGEAGQRQEVTGRRIHGFEFAIILDSLFMSFRNSAVPDLGVIDETVQPYHFLDKLWPLRLVRHSWQVGILGVCVDHLGGMTGVFQPKWADSAAVDWLTARHAPTSNEGEAAQEYVDSVINFARSHSTDDLLAMMTDIKQIVYIEAEREFLRESYSMHMIPGEVDVYGMYRFRNNEMTPGVMLI